MAATVDILITATDNASRVLQSVSSGAGLLDKGVSSLKSSFKEMGRGVADAVQDLTGFSLSQLTVAGAITGTVAAVKRAVEGYTSYVASVDKLSQQTGVASEELSRLIQTADDFRVEQSSMTAAMTMAVQNGYKPSLEFIAKLSDEYRSIQDPVERTNRLQEVFGRQWRDIVPLLEQGGKAIRDNAAGIADGLVVTESAIEQNRQLAKSLDDINDAWTAVQNSLVKSALPEWAGSLKIFADNVNDLSSGEKNLGQVLVENQKHYADLDRELAMNRAATRAKADGDRYAAQAAAYQAQQTKAVVLSGQQLVQVGNYTRSMNVSLANSYDSVTRAMQRDVLGSDRRETAL